MEHANLVAHELREAGFETTISDNQVNVSLRNRKVSKAEVETVLEQIFEDISFKVETALFFAPFDGVRVTK